MDWWIIVVLFLELSFVSFLLWLGAAYRQRVLDRRSRERLGMLKRFNSDEELSAFLQSERGGQWLELFEKHRPNPWRLVIAALVAGLVILFVGAAFWILVAFEVFGDAEVFIIPAVLVSCAGVGILVATALATIVGSRRGLLPSASANGPTGDDGRG